MGLFDEVLVPCPACGAELRYQSKGAECPYLDTYPVAEAPPAVLADTDGKTETCAGCGARWTVRAPMTVTFRLDPA